jgi:hypothetical protein
MRLRGGRSLRDFHTALRGPPVGRRKDCSGDQRERRPEGYTGHEVTAARAGRFFLYPKSGGGRRGRR